jgi:hypothetical protein
MFKTEEESLMKTIFLLALSGLIASDAMAVSRYNSQSMTCSAVHARIGQEGEVILRYPSRNNSVTIYDRYVSTSAGCVNLGLISKTSVPTADNPQCPVQRCVSTTGQGNSRR